MKKLKLLILAMFFAIFCAGCVVAPYGGGYYGGGGHHGSSYDHNHHGYHRGFHR